MGDEPALRLDAGGGADKESEPVSNEDDESSETEQPAVPPIVNEVLRAPGQPLDPSARDFAETHLGDDFRQVRVHTDAKAAESARAVNAQAYTVGSDIVFASGQYAPTTGEGQRLLAHELGHVSQQAGAATQTIQRQPAGKEPAGDDLGKLELELQSKLSERAMLARMLEEASDKHAADVSKRRIKTGSKGEEAKLKAGAQGDFEKRASADLLKNKVDVVPDKDGFTLNVRIELSYPGRTNAEGLRLSANDLPRIKQALREAWSVDMTEGRYAGKKFRLEPRIEFRPPTRKADDKALQFIIRKGAGGDTVAQWDKGEVSFNPEHLEGDRVVIAAHELYHLFGWIVDMYYEPKPGVKSGPSAYYSVGRPDLKGRADLLGMVDPKKLREWLAKGVITKAEFERQMRGPIKVWQEDAERLLYALGAPPSPAKTAPTIYDPNSPTYDPQAAQRAKEAEAKRAEAETARVEEQGDETKDVLEKMERAMQLDEEIAALQKRIDALKASGAKKPAKP